MNEKQRLEILDIFIALPSIESVNLFVFTEFVRLQFAGITDLQKNQNYRNNPANTLLFRALEAKANLDLVNVIEHIRNEESMFKKLKTNIKGKWNLVLHRNVISHPATTVWSDPQTQAFYDNRQHYFLSKALEIWKVKRSLENGLIKLKSKTNNPISIQTRPEFAEFFISIMTLSLQSHISIPASNSIQASLNTYFANYDSNLRAQY